MGALQAGPAHALLTVPIAAGVHRLDYEVTVRGAANTLPYMRDYKLIHRGRATVDARDGQVVSVTATAAEPKGMLAARGQPTVVTVEGSSHPAQVGHAKTDAELLAEVEAEANARLARERFAQVPTAPPLLAAVAAEPRPCAMPNVRFGFKRSYLDRASQAELNRLGKCIASLPGAKLRLSGHADQRGSIAFNRRLGFLRASAVARHLRALGVEATRIEVTTAGPTKPLCREATERCYASNRRVEIAFDATNSTSITASR